MSTIAGPGRMSPVTGWQVWKSDSLNTIGRYPATDAGLASAIAKATEYANK